VPEIGESAIKARLAEVDVPKMETRFYYQLTYHD